MGHVFFSGMTLTPMDTDTEEQSRHLLAPSQEYIASVRVFPLIPHIKKDVTVSTFVKKDKGNSSSQWKFRRQLVRRTVSPLISNSLSLHRNCSQLRVCSSKAIQAAQNLTDSAGN